MCARPKRLLGTFQLHAEHPANLSFVRERLQPSGEPDNGVLWSAPRWTRYASAVRAPRYSHTASCPSSAINALGILPRRALDDGDRRRCGCPCQTLAAATVLTPTTSPEAPSLAPMHATRLLPTRRRRDHPADDRTPETVTDAAATETRTDAEDDAAATTDAARDDVPEKRPDAPLPAPRYARGVAARTTGLHPKLAALLAARWRAIRAATSRTPGGGPGTPTRTLAHEDGGWHIAACTAGTRGEGNDFRHQRSARRAGAGQGGARHLPKRLGAELPGNPLADTRC